MRNFWHEIYTRRGKRNAWLGVLMGLLVVLIFLVTIVKLAAGIKIQGFDHTIRPELTERVSKIES